MLMTEQLLLTLFINEDGINPPETECVVCGSDSSDVVLGNASMPERVLMFRIPGTERYARHGIHLACVVAQQPSVSWMGTITQSGTSGTATLNTKVTP